MRVETTRARGARLSGFGCGAAILAMSVVLAVVSVVSVVLFLVSSGRNDAVASFIHPQPGSLRWDGHQRLNVLLLGVDNRSSRSASARALLVVSLDVRAHTMRVLGVPPDLWMTLPGFGPGRIADTYADGGPAFTLRMVEDITHVPIPYYAVVDSDTLRRVIDAMGGLSMGVPTVISGSSPAVQVGDLEMQGLARQKRHLTGASALEFMRAGAAEAEGEIAEMDREQQVLFALVGAARQPQTFVRIPSLVSTLGGSVSTNFPYNQVPELARELASVPESQIRGGNLGYANHAVGDYNTDGQHLLLPDWEHISSIAQQMLGDPSISQGAAVVVWNGSGVDGQAASLSQWLEHAGVRVRSFGSAPHDYRRTAVLVRSAATLQDRYTAHAVATLLGAPVVRQQTHGGPVITIIIGHDFQDPNPQ